MYEMYPEAWTEDQAHRRHRLAGDHPRRRARKPHSVVPAVILAQSESNKDEQAG
jgi:hypothetical protein